MKVMVKEASAGLMCRMDSRLEQGDQGWVQRTWIGALALGVERKGEHSKEINRPSPAIIRYHVFKRLPFKES